MTCRHGGDGGAPSTIELEEGEIIKEIHGKTDGVILGQLTFITQKPDDTTGTYGPYGQIGDIEFSADGTIIGFHGRAGSLLDAIGLYFL